MSLESVTLMLCSIQILGITTVLVIQKTYN